MREEIKRRWERDSENGKEINRSKERRWYAKRNYRLLFCSFLSLFVSYFFNFLFFCICFFQIKCFKWTHHRIQLSAKNCYTICNVLLLMLLSLVFAVVVTALNYQMLASTVSFNFLFHSFVCVCAFVCVCIFIKLNCFVRVL